LINLSISIVSIHWFKHEAESRARHVTRRTTHWTLNESLNIDLPFPLSLEESYHFISLL
jgi:hypothetical protein